MMIQENGDRVVLRDGVIEVTLGEIQSAKSVSAVVDEVKRLSGMSKYDILIDLSNAKVSEGTGLAMAKELIHELPFNKFAAFGSDMRLANLNTRELVRYMDDSDRMKLFRIREDAIAWLESRK